MLVIFMVFWCLTSCSLVIQLNSSMLPKFISSLLSINPFSPRYSLCEVVFVVMYTLLL